MTYYVSMYSVTHSVCLSVCLSMSPCSACISLYGPKLCPGQYVGLDIGNQSIDQSPNIHIHRGHVDNAKPKSLATQS